MTKKDTDFNNWFEILRMNLLDHGITFKDADSVRDDYNDGKDLFDVVNDIRAEYA